MGLGPTIPSRTSLLVAIQPESGFQVLAAVCRACEMARWRCQRVRMVTGGGPRWCYGGAVAGGSQGPSVNSRVRASRASMPHLAVVDR